MQELATFTISALFVLTYAKRDRNVFVVVIVYLCGMLYNFHLNKNKFKISSKYPWTLLHYCFRHNVYGPVIEYSTTNVYFPS